MAMVSQLYEKEKRTRGPQARTPPARKAGPQGLRALCPAAYNKIDPVPSSTSSRTFHHHGLLEV